MTALKRAGLQINVRIMKNTSEKVLLNEAVAKMAADMESREIGAIIWNVGQAGFHFIPEIVVDPKDGARPVRVTGLYRYDGRLYAIEEDVAEIHPKDFYTPDVDVPPVVVTLSEKKAEEVLGDPTERRGFTTEGTVEEWTVIADCYFEALAEE